MFAYEKGAVKTEYKVAYNETREVWEVISYVSRRRLDSDKIDIFTNSCGCFSNEPKAVQACETLRRMQNV